jgi:hypothetical protein
VGVKSGGIWERIADLARLGFGGGQVYDALIAWCAADAGATVLLTWNLKHFATIASPDLQVREPEALVPTLAETERTECENNGSENGQRKHLRPQHRGPAAFQEQAADGMNQLAYRDIVGVSLKLFFSKGLHWIEARGANQVSGAWRWGCGQR